MGIQKDADTVDYPVIVQGGGNPATAAPAGQGGNMHLVNQNEAEIIESMYESTPVVQIGYAEDSSTIQGVFREQAL